MIDTLSFENQNNPSTDFSYVPCQTIVTDSKFIEIFDIHVIIKEDTDDAFELFYVGDDQRREYYKEVVNNYKTAEQLEWCEILQADDKNHVVVSKMPRYTPLLEMNQQVIYSNNFNMVEKLFDLWKRLYSLNVSHGDLALRNIGYNPMLNQLEVFDLCDLFHGKEELCTSEQVETALVYLKDLPNEMYQSLYQKVKEFYSIT